MNGIMPQQQRGLSFGGFVFGAFLLVLVSTFGLKLIPPYIEDAKIQSTFNDLVHEPDLQKATPKDFQNAFDRHAAIDDITAIKSSDIDISADGDRVVLSATYSVKVPMVANMSVLLEFNPTSGK